MSSRSSNPADTGQMRQLRHRLANDLLPEGNAASWREVFGHVPRHVFVPRVFIDRGNCGYYESIEGSNPWQYDEWLAAVYGDDVLITQLDGTDDEWVPGGKPTSSSTMPSLMALMLSALDIRAGMNVLEIGAGTGYNAALLCEKLGSANVTSVDIDPALVESARHHLSVLGYTPTLMAGDGSLGYAPNAPYDRILATVSLPHLPRAWIEQTYGGGLILVNVYRDLGAGALVLLTAQRGQAEGKFLAGSGGFMPIRAENVPDTLKLLKVARSETGESRFTTLDGHVLDHPDFGLFAALRISARRIESQTEGQPGKFWLVSRDGSWAYQTTDTTGQRVAVQNGRHRLWDELEEIHDEWLTLGRPSRNDFGLTVTLDGRHFLWHVHPGGPNWELTSDAGAEPAGIEP